jgi:predicted MFS family arabinose efflux permease
LKHTNGLVRYLIASSLVRTADEASRVLLLLVAIDRVDSARLGGLLVACFLVPHVIAAPATGVLADRARNRARFQAVALGFFGCCLAATGVLTGSIPLALLLAIALAGGCVGPLVTGGMTSLVGTLVPAEQRDRAYGLDVLTYNIAGVIGPAGAAFLVHQAGPVVASLTAGAFGIAGAVIVATLAIPPVTREAAPVPLSLRALVSPDAAHLMLRNRTLRATTLGSSLGAAGFAIIPLATVLLAERADRPALTSLLVGATALGGIVGSVLYAWRPYGSGNPCRTAAIALAGIAMPLLVATTVTAHDGVLILLFTLAGFPTGPLASSVFVVRDRESPPALRTQVFTLAAGLKMTCSAIGAFAGGLAVSAGAIGLLVTIAVVHLGATVLTLLIDSRGS